MSSDFSPLRMIFPQEVCQNTANVQMGAQARATKEEDNFSVKFTFILEKGNVKSMTSHYSAQGTEWIEEETNECKYEYDNKNNPLSGFHLNLTDGIENYYSKNNVTKVSENWRETETEDGYTETESGYLEYSYDYEYDGKWPVSRTFREPGSVGGTYYYEYE